MVRINVSRNKIIVSGHAEYAEKGKDIVCSAVSAIVQTTLLGLKAYSIVEYENREGYLKIEILDPNMSVDVLINTMIRGLNEIQKEYPNYVSITHHKNMWR